MHSNRNFFILNIDVLLCWNLIHAPIKYVTYPTLNTSRSQQSGCYRILREAFGLILGVEHDPYINCMLLKITLYMSFILVDAILRLWACGLRLIHTQTVRTLGSRVTSLLETRISLRRTFLCCVLCTYGPCNGCASRSRGPAKCHNGYRVTELCVILNLNWLGDHGFWSRKHFFFV